MQSGVQSTASTSLARNNGNKSKQLQDNYQYAGTLGLEVMRHQQETTSQIQNVSIL